MFYKLIASTEIDRQTECCIILENTKARAEPNFTKHLILLNCPTKAHRKKLTFAKIHVLSNNYNQIVRINFQASKPAFHSHCARPKGRYILV